MPFQKNGGSQGTQSRTNPSAQTLVQTQAKRNLDAVEKQKDQKNKKKKKLSSQTTEKRKEQKRISMQRARERLRNDPIRFEEEKAKERERYHRRKKTVGEMSERMKRSVRKKWKNQKRNQREKVKKQYIFEERLRNDSPPETPRSASPNITPQISSFSIARPSGSSSSRLESGRKKAKKNSERLRKENQKLKEENKKIIRKLEKYKKRVQRYKAAESKNNTIDFETPTKKMKRLITESNSKEIKKCVLFGEVIKEQIKESFKGEKSKKKRKQILKVLAGKITKKYKYLEYVRSITSKKIGRTSKTVHGVHNKEGMLRSSKVKLAIQKFLETDEASRICAGKKETITQCKIKMQKHYLNNTLLNLIKVFKKENPSLTNISYRTFCRYRPFWVLYPTIKDRETCLCKTHENMDLVVSKLNYFKMIKERSADEVVKNMCCKERRRECLERNCENCKGKNIETIEFEDEAIRYKKWETKKIPAVINGKEKLVQKTIKNEIITTKKQLFEILCVDIFKFMQHISNINHQYEHVRKIKKNLSPRDMLLHFDFSENFLCKYAKEVQATHFGASKHQVTVHTAVLYCYAEKPKCFATVSDCNRHDPSAVSAHLSPLIDHMKAYVPKPKCVHFLSDGAPTQYKNKNMFYLFFHKLTKQLQCDKVHWHFYESGHGKGAPDGVGASLKRTADNLVAMGIDIPNSEILVANLKANCKGVIVETVKEDDIQKADLLLPKTIQTFKGTRKIRQIKWIKNSAVLHARRLTCLNCDSYCPHFGLGVIKELSISKNLAANVSTQSLEPIFPSAIQFEELSTGMWIIVEFEGLLYPGEIMQIRNEEHIEVSVMHLIHDGQFSWPDKLDLIPYPLSDVKAIIKPPIPTASGSRKINYVFPECQNILFQ